MNAFQIKTDSIKAVLDQLLLEGATYEGQNQSLISSVCRLPFFVSFIKVSNDKNYFIFTSEINNSNSQLGFFSGNFVGIGMTMNRIKKL